MTAFATYSDVATRLGRTFTGTEQAQVTAFLDDATAYLRRVIGQDVTAATSTAVLSLAPDADWLLLPQQPVRGVTSVEVGPAGSEVAVTDFELVDGALYLGPRWWPFGLPLTALSGYQRVVVTYDHGLSAVPDDLKAWAIVLAAQAFAQVEREGSMGAPRLRQQSIDDFAQSFDTSGPATFSLPAAEIDRLRAAYGGGVYITRPR